MLSYAYSINICPFLRRTFFEEFDGFSTIFDDIIIFCGTFHEKKVFFILYFKIFYFNII